MEQVSHESEKKESSNTNSSAQLLITLSFGFIMFVLGLGFGYVLFANRIPIQPTVYNVLPEPTAYNYLTPTIHPPPPITYSPKTIQQPYTLVSTSKTSPNGEYVVKQGEIAEEAQLALLDGKNNVLVEDLLLLNEKEIGYNEKFACQCGTRFKGWYSDNQFVIVVANALGEQYEFLVSAPSGKVDEASFHRIPDIQ